MADTFTDDAGFELIPSDDVDLLSGDDLVAAAEASLTDDPFASPGTEPPRIPFGRTWAWDRQNQRYLRIGQAPAEVRGRDCLREWIYNALQTAQGVHPVLSDEFGIEDPDDWIGLSDPTDALATFEPRAREAVTQHERIEELDELSPEFDPSTGIITITDIVVVTDEAEAVPLTSFDITPTF